MCVYEMCLVPKLFPFSSREFKGVDAVCVKRTKIIDFDNSRAAIWEKQNVSRLEIAVYDVFSVEILETWTTTNSDS